MFFYSFESELNCSVGFLNNTIRCPFKRLDWLSKSYLLLVLSSPNIIVRVNKLHLRRRGRIRHHFIRSITKIATMLLICCMIRFICCLNPIRLFESNHIIKMLNSDHIVLLVLPLENIANSVSNCIKRLAKVITILTIDLEIVETSTNSFWNHLNWLSIIVYRLTIFELQMSLSV